MNSYICMAAAMRIGCMDLEGTAVEYFDLQ